MSIGFTIAINAVPFFDLLDQEVESLATEVFEAEDQRNAASAMDSSRRRLSQGVDAFVRALPASVRNDNAARLAAYALVGLADERMLHYAAGGLERWRERLLEYELYNSALAGQEIIRQAQSAAHGMGASVEAGGGALLAPLYLAVLREGFEGSLRGDTLGLAALRSHLEETVGAIHGILPALAGDVGPSRLGLAPMPAALIGILLWLVGGVALWGTLPRDALRDAELIAERVRIGLPVDSDIEPRRSIGPSGLPGVNDMIPTPAADRANGRR